MKRPIPGMAAAAFARLDRDLNALARRARLVAEHGRDLAALVELAGAPLGDTTSARPVDLDLEAALEELAADDIALRASAGRGEFVRLKPRSPRRLGEIVGGGPPVAAAPRRGVRLTTRWRGYR